MRILLTRPMADAMTLAEPLAAQGHDVLLSPVIDIEPRAHPLSENLSGLLPKADNIAALALTSVNGVRALAACLQDADIFAQWRDKPAFAVGPQTAAALAALKWPLVHQAGGDVAALAACIIDKAAEINFQKYGAVLHIAGRHQAGRLQETLQAANIACEKAVLYEAVAADGFNAATQMALLDEEEPVDAVIVYSQRSAELFCRFFHELQQTADKPVLKPMAICLSPPIAAFMQEQGFICHSAATPDSAAVLQLVAQLAKAVSQ